MRIAGCDAEFLKNRRRDPQGHAEPFVIESRVLPVIDVLADTKPDGLGRGDPLAIECAGFSGRSRYGAAIAKYCAPTTAVLTTAPNKPERIAPPR